jgi:glyoxylase-like metal-dependent hydrolase (beta-lactamase superfamily II)
VRRYASRRNFCRVALGSAALAACAPRVLAQEPGPSTFPLPVSWTPEGVAPALAVTRLSPTLMVVTGAGGNVVVALGPDGVLLVNGGHESRSAALIAQVGQLAGGLPVKTLFNTDWHAEHTGSNVPLGKAGATILSHEFTKQYLSTEMTVEWRNATYKACAPQGRPAKTFYTKGTMTLGPEQVEYGHLGQAHTDGDIYVYFRNDNVLVAGDTLGAGRYPIADYNSGGWIGGLVAANKTLLDLTNADPRFVPGVGPVQARAALQVQHDMLAAVRDRMHKLFRQGMGLDDMLASGVTKDYDAAWGSPDLFVATSFRGMWLHIRELGGVV